LFKDQIARGGPVTVTHSEVKRFFMTIPEAVQLVLQAATLGKGGEVFLLDMGDPVKIVDLATDLVELSGLQVGQDVEIVITGLRPGEKLFEELFVEGEEYVPTRHERIFAYQNGLLSSGPKMDLEQQVSDLFSLALSGDEAKIRAKLAEVVPEYAPPHVPGGGS
jgi:FlaA1/EpsC-like NDP-sugar epimerase